jgi:cytochrome d ubiquinol oxidase subunit I
MPKSKLFLLIATAAGVLSVVTLEAGWVVTEVGRQPWIVRNYMRVEDAATANTGVWVTFVAVVLIYAGLAVTVILVLRQMSRRWREGDAEAEIGEGGPYGPRPTPAPDAPRAAVDREPVP